MEQRIAAIRSFAFDTDRCRANTLLSYFGESPAEPCGKCDVCRSRRQQAESSGSTLSDSIVYQASHPGGAAVSALVATLGPHYGHDNVTAAIRTLVDRNTLRLNNGRVILTQ